jgi:hypothetical protein
VMACHSYTCVLPLAFLQAMLSDGLADLACVYPCSEGIYRAWDCSRAHEHAGTHE